MADSANSVGAPKWRRQGPWCVLDYVPTYLLCHSRAER